MAQRPVGRHTGAADARPPAQPPSDRRLARGRRNRASIVEATVDLINAGNRRPTHRQVATRADLAVRTVYNHFGDTDALFCGAAQQQLSRQRDRLVPIPPHGPIGSRIRATCRQRRQLFEETGPVVRAAHTRTDGSKRFKEMMSQHEAWLRGLLSATLGPEIEAQADQADALFDMLAVATGWEQWNAMRGSFGHSANDAERLMADAVGRILAREANR
jgi:TetR/AcrR family transcriptional regulator, regulator of autoinduction and epiphytic fitness